MATEDDYWHISHDQARGFVRLTRTARPFPSIEATLEIQRALGPRLERFRGLPLLLDFSGGPPGRNDEDFEAAVAPARRQLDAIFPRVALLLRSRAGELQVRRMAKKEQRAAFVFLNEAEAVKWLTEA